MKRHTKGLKNVYTVLIYNVLHFSFLKIQSGSLRRGTPCTWCKGTTKKRKNKAGSIQETFFACFYPRDRLFFKDIENLFHILLPLAKKLSGLLFSLRKDCLRIGKRDLEKGKQAAGYRRARTRKNAFRSTVFAKRTMHCLCPCKCKQQGFPDFPAPVCCLSLG